MARILLLDDDDDVRQAIETVLRAAGHDVTVATNGAQGLRLQRATPFDLVVTDMMMPEMDGIELIRALSADWPRLPIIAVSSGGRFETPVYLKTAQVLGAVATIAKPIKPEELLARVASALGA